MNELLVTDDQQAVEVLTTDLDLSNFIDQMLSLDKATYDSIYDDPNERERFSKLSPDDRLKFFSQEFQDVVFALYNSFVTQKTLTHNLALNVYQIGLLTGATYKEIADHLEAALQKQFSKSYISKLYRVGKMLTVAPQLAVISDTEKLAELSRVPEARLAQMIEQTSEGIVRVANCDVAQASRAKIQEIVRKEVPKTISKPTLVRPTPVVQPVASTWNKQELLDTLNLSLTQVDQSEAELRLALQECIRIINLSII